MDIIFLAYANSSTSPLPTLSREDDGVFSVLVNRQLKGHFLLHRDSFTTLEKINEYLGKYGERLALFSFSGHADGATLHLGDGSANARGIAHQLGASARAGKLKLVILNGCSTAGQVKALLEAGVPAVIATSAPVGDRSAAEFNLSLFRGFSERRLTIREAFEQALGAAQAATERDLRLEEIPRGLDLREASTPGEQALWGLYCRDPQALEVYPLPRRTDVSGRPGYEPNDLLTQVLFDTLRKVGCREVRNLHEQEEEGEYVEPARKQRAVVNVLPFPVAIHLQKLICPVEQDNEGFDKVSLRRLEQTGAVFHSTVEFMACIMLAQLWEVKLTGPAGALPESLRETIRDYFRLPAKERAVFDFLPFIRSIRRYLDTLNEGEGIPYFVEELGHLKELVRETQPFAVACDYLAHLRRQTVAGRIEEAEVPEMCEEAESHLAAFFAELGFLHRYTLTSIQNIDIRKYRHHLAPTFSHETVKLMHAFGKAEQIYYLLPTFLDNRGVALIKGKMRVSNIRRKEFAGEELGFLNLSPFIIDRNAFEEHTDRSNLLFFAQPGPEEGAYVYRSVKRPDHRQDRLEVRRDGPFEAVVEQLEAFREMILKS